MDLSHFSKFKPDSRCRHTTALLFTTVVFICLYQGLHASKTGTVVTLEDKSGRSLEARILSMDEESVTFARLPDGAEFTTALNNLSDACVSELQRNIPTAWLSIYEGWKNRDHKGEEKNAIEDLERYLSGFRPEVDLSGDQINEPTVIFENVTYLMPLDKLRDMLGSRVGIYSKRQVLCPGFPEDSFRLYLFPIKDYGSNKPNHVRDTYEHFSDKLDGFNLLAVMTDLNDQVCAIQLESHGLEASGYISREKRNILFNVLQTKKVAGGAEAYLIKAYGSKISSPIKTYQKLDNGRIAAYNELYLPPPIGNLVLWNIQNRWKW